MKLNADSSLSKVHSAKQAEIELFWLICCNRGPSTNLFHLTLVITATICCWMMWAIVYLAQMKPLIVPILNEGE
ncbi:hypothetical protein L3X38_024012 [Prunus dulcis]|uniref:Uncharacterized protein n=1 Tax=Prunus dulcis TaxID=3755 RepID=A0AAD4Z5R9_PRUDU|nr:hypothetical protein L3X38_024012 [Prunus dulcis]